MKSYFGLTRLGEYANRLADCTKNAIPVTAALGALAAGPAQPQVPDSSFTYDHETIEAIKRVFTTEYIDGKPGVTLAEFLKSPDVIDGENVLDSIATARNLSTYLRSFYGHRLRIEDIGWFNGWDRYTDGLLTARDFPDLPLAKNKQTDDYRRKLSKALDLRARKRAER
jgi:hypothetical protein